jgi:hypothetical protein
MAFTFTTRLIKSAQQHGANPEPMRAAIAELYGLLPAIDPSDVH